MKDDVDQLREMLGELAEHWPELHRQRELGTPRRWTELLLEQERDEQGRPIPRAVNPACEFCGEKRVQRRYCAGRICPTPADDDMAPQCPHCGQQRLHRWRCLNAHCIAGVTRPAYTRFLPTAIGESRAPLRIGSLAAIALITTAMLELEDLVRDQLGRVERFDPQFDMSDPRGPLVAGVRPVESRKTELTGDFLAFCRVPGTYDPQEFDRIEYIAATYRTVDVDPVDMDERVTDAISWLASQLLSIADDADLLTHTAEETRRVLSAARETVGANQHIQHLKDPCPICNRLSLVVLLDRALIFCGSNSRGCAPRCECNIEDCACHRGYRHNWVYDDDDERNEWKVLLRHIENEAKARRAG